MNLPNKKHLRSLMTILFFCGLVVQQPRDACAKMGW